MQHLKDPGRWDGESHTKLSLGSGTGCRVISPVDPDGQEANSNVVRVHGMYCKGFALLMHSLSNSRP